MPVTLLVLARLVPPVVISDSWGCQTATPSKRLNAQTHTHQRLQVVSCPHCVISQVRNPIRGGQQFSGQVKGCVQSGTSPLMHVVVTHGVTRVCNSTSSSSGGRRRRRRGTRKLLGFERGVSSRDHRAHMCSKTQRGQMQCTNTTRNHFAHLVLPACAAP